MGRPHRSKAKIPKGYKKSILQSKAPNLRVKESMEEGREDSRKMGSIARKKGVEEKSRSGRMWTR